MKPALALLAFLPISALAAPSAPEPDATEAFSRALVKGQEDMLSGLARAQSQRSLRQAARDALRGEVKLLGRAAEQALQAAYRDNGIKEAAEAFMEAPLSAGPAEWGAAALVGGSVALVGGIRAQAALPNGRLRLRLASGLRMRDRSGSRELGDAELSIGPMTIAAAVGRRAGRLEASRIALNYSLRY